ncbi:MAG: histidine--tRNA ligase, partial [Bacteroidetes bacterium]
PILQEGINEIDYILSFHKQNLSYKNDKNFELQFDITLARGLNYYTGTIFEAKANVGNFQPSILGGGRYDDLTGIFDLPDVSGVGISFGIDRIYDVMEEAGLFPSQLNNISPAQILLIYMDEVYLPYVFEMANYLRKNNISTEIYHQKDKLKKCFDYAHKKSFPYVGIVGESEASQRMMSLKNMQSGEQQTLNLAQIIQILNNQ